MRITAWKHFESSKMLHECSCYCVSSQQDPRELCKLFRFRFRILLRNAVLWYVFDLKQESPEEHIMDLFLHLKGFQTYFWNLLPACTEPITQLWLLLDVGDWSLSLSLIDWISDCVLSSNKISGWLNPKKETHNKSLFCLTMRPEDEICQSSYVA